MGCFVPSVWKLGLQLVTIMSVVFLVGIYLVFRAFENGYSKVELPKRKCTMKDARKLFASRIVAIDGESQKRIQSLEAKCISLEKKNAVLIKTKAEWRKREAEWKQREALLQQQLHQFKEKTNYLEHFLDVQSRTSGHPPSMGGYQVPSLGNPFSAILLRKRHILIGLMILSSNP